MVYDARDNDPSVLVCRDCGAEFGIYQAHWDCTKRQIAQALAPLVDRVAELERRAQEGKSLRSALAAEAFEQNSERLRAAMGELAEATAQEANRLEREEPTGRALNDKVPNLWGQLVSATEKWRRKEAREQYEQGYNPVTRWCSTTGQPYRPSYEVAQARADVDTALGAMMREASREAEWESAGMCFRCRGVKTGPVGKHHACACAEDGR